MAFAKEAEEEAETFAAAAAAVPLSFSPPLKRRGG